MVQGRGKKDFYCSPGPANTYAKCKQRRSLPLSLVTRANYCAVFIRVEMICANKERRPSSTHCCVFSSQNCKWMQPPHLVPAGSVPVPPITALLTGGIRQESGCVNGRRWCLINTFSPSNRSHTYFTACQGGLQPRSKCEDAWQTGLFMQKLAHNFTEESVGDSVWPFSICFVILKGASLSTLA